MVKVKMERQEGCLRWEAHIAGRSKHVCTFVQAGIREKSVVKTDLCTTGAAARVGDTFKKLTFRDSLQPIQAQFHLLIRPWQALNLRLSFISCPQYQRSLHVSQQCVTGLPNLDMTRD